MKWKILCWTTESVVQHRIFHLANMWKRLKSKEGRMTVLIHVKQIGFKPFWRRWINSSFHRYQEKKCLHKETSQELAEHGWLQHASGGLDNHLCRSCIWKIWVPQWADALKPHHEQFNCSGCQTRAHLDGLALPWGMSLLRSAEKPSTEWKKQFCNTWTPKGANPSQLFLSWKVFPQCCLAASGFMLGRTPITTQTCHHTANTHLRIAKTGSFPNSSLLTTFVVLEVQGVLGKEKPNIYKTGEWWEI